MKCKFCGMRITTNHYFITRSGTCCTSCKENIREMLRGIVDVKKGGLNESDSSGGICGDSSTDNDGREQKKVNGCVN